MDRKCLPSNALTESDSDERHARWSRAVRPRAAALLLLRETAEEDKENMVVGRGKKKRRGRQPETKCQQRRK